MSNDRKNNMELWGRGQAGEGVKQGRGRSKGRRQVTGFQVQYIIPSSSGTF